MGDPLSNLTDKLAAAHAAAAAAAIENASKPNNATRTIGSNASASSSAISLQPPVTAPATGSARRLSYLTPIDLATGAISTADQGIRGIGNTLESSYKFLFGKMEKRGEELPKTLEDARKLVDPPAASGFEEEKTTLAGGDGGLKRVDSEASIKSTQSVKQEKEASFGTPPRAVTTPAAVAAEKLGSLGTSIGRFAVRGFSRSSTPVATSLTQTEVLTGAAKGLGIVSQDKGHKRNDSAPIADLLSVCIYLDLSLILEEEITNLRRRRFPILQIRYP